MINIILCDENGYPYKRLHYGHHGNKRSHNFVTTDNPFYKHAHDITYVESNLEIIPE